MEHSILIVEDDATLAGNIRTYLERRRYEARVCASAEEALAVLEEQRPDVLLTDHSLPGMSGLELVARVRASDPRIKPIVMTGYGNVEDAVAAMKAGSYHYLTKPVVLAELKLLIDKALEAQRLEHALSFYQAREARAAGLEALIGDSPVMHALKTKVRQLLEAERRMTDADLPVVLIEGETGTGKELVARALHFDGARRHGPFVEVNCASIPAHLLEAELFGHERGAFTDAKERRVGLVEAADGGTLFLDEIGEIELSLQAKLLKLLEDRSIRRLGAVKARKVDLRIVAATNCNLERMVRQGKFRRDLFFRLRIIELKVPPLRERGEDVIALAEHYLALHGRRYGKPELAFSARARALLKNYDWPGNVRELRNMLEQTALLATGRLVEPAQLALCPELMERGEPCPAPLREPGAALAGEGLKLPELERDLVLRMLDRTDWNVTKSARLLGLTRDMLRYRIEKLGLSRPDRRH
ncbi:sigma54-dependent response regulator, two-component [Azotobacter vinelandii CA]|uniref:Sigma54-dependent response regulator, two-component n=2 Tax=Azotobacter vinelandii TaxID=354 RepID=C1DLY2_AZOVD|nr:sigma-54 dependent transcriptional regulator [Azotobacter vinelandii]ACO79069.1 sigma54-dependent response regulator, two-component [Azotobacter vinelandii DJ]AGK16515.1 sigma54-dependent response regulator, two-component [Azotobacter vinelandii CA]AGK20942.1 sigma54-dependent response regulator, two-component [Azotobacter vinelandii CA6]WKN20049.1 sigma-54 dependent transcriptional regulator [Azotobacter vinelandii]SFX51558.1 DNA-binding transcriptional response regulator, NtrC family, con